MARRNDETGIMNTSGLFEVAAEFRYGASRRDNRENENRIGDVMKAETMTSVLRIRFDHPLPAGTCRIPDVSPSKRCESAFTRRSNALDPVNVSCWIDTAEKGQRA